MPRNNWIQMLGIVAVLIVCAALIPASAEATIIRTGEDTTIYHDTVLTVDIGDTLGSPGTGVPVSVILDNLTDSVQGFQLSITLSRPDLMVYESDTVATTCYECANPPVCDEIIEEACTLAVVPSTTQGTLVQQWDFTQANTFGGLNIRLTGIADVDGDQYPLPIVPFVQGVLIKVIGQMTCEIPDSDSDRVVTFDINTVGTYFSDTKGKVIPGNDSVYYGMPDTTIVNPDTTLLFDSLVVYERRIRIQDGTVTVPYSLIGDVDHNGVFNVFDVVYLVSTAFRNGAAPCPFAVGDLNCDGTINVFDVVALVNHVFRAGPQPLPCS